MREKGDFQNIKDIRLFLFDMDGTLYLGYDLFGFAKELLQTIKAQGKKYLFMTNNSSKSVSAYVEKLAKLGIKSDENDFITSSQATALYLNNNLPDKKLYVAGTKSFKDELRASGVNVYEDYSDEIEGVVMGFDTELTFKKLDDVSKLLTLKKDIPFIAANPDFVCPTEYGYVPDCGSVCGMIFNATGRKPFYIGKPRPEMPLLAIEKMRKTDPSIDKNTTLVVGDRMYTDIACGINAKTKTMLVLSGETTEEQAYGGEYEMDYIARDAGRILEILKQN
ncbi:MAG: HAD-IIA family hydrolase [Clostridia bacterium]|nr:HAD-IIA family hydrolase [Clostridia bacterium]